MSSLCNQNVGFKLYETDLLFLKALSEYKHTASIEHDPDWEPYAPRDLDMYVDRSVLISLRD